MKSRLILTEPITPRKVMTKDPHDHVLDVIAVFSRILKEMSLSKNGQVC